MFSALPSELTVLDDNGTTVYTENLHAKAAEAAQFCEGYAEPAPGGYAGSLARW